VDFKWFCRGSPAYDAEGLLQYDGVEEVAYLCIPTARLSCSEGVGTDMVEMIFWFSVRRGRWRRRRSMELGREKTKASVMKARLSFNADGTSLWVEGWRSENKQLLAWIPCD
jgi:hypothetical protein